MAPALSRSGYKRTIYQNSSSCVLNNSFSIGSFDVVQRGVKQADLFFPYLFILVRKVLAIGMLENSRYSRNLSEQERNQTQSIWRLHI